MKGPSRLVATVVAIVFLVGLCPARAELIGVFGPLTIEATRIPTPQLPGFSTWTVSVTSSSPVYDFEFAPYTTGLYAGHGFHGPMNQINPGGAATVFNDADSIYPFVGANPLQDSHFLVRSTEVGRPVDTQFESANGLGADFGRLNYFGTHADFAQIVKADTSVVTFLGTIFYGPNVPSTSQVVSGSLGVLPEPSGIALVVIGLLASVGVGRRGRSSERLGALYK